jgi:hypothetical protein
VNGTKALRGLEAGTRAGWLVVAGVAVFIVWRLLSPKRKEGDIVEVVPILPPVRPATSGDAPEPRNQAEPQGIVGGSLMTAVVAQIIDPPEGGRVYRRMLSAAFPATIELSSVMRDPTSVQIEVVLDFYELTGGERLGVRTRFPVRQIRGDGLERFEVQLDSGNVNNLAYEFGQANAVAKVYTNGILTQSTSFEVW